MWCQKHIFSTENKVEIEEKLLYTASHTFQLFSQLETSLIQLCVTLL